MKKRFGIAQNVRLCTANLSPFNQCIQGGNIMMKLLFVGLILSNVVSGKTSTDVFIAKYKTMDECLYAAKKINQETQWYDGSHFDRRWDFCIPIYGTDETK